MRLATLALDAGVVVDVDVLQRAARIALFGNDRHLAVRLAEEAFARRTDFDAGHALADALYEAGDFEPMRQHWTRWQPLATTDGQRVIVAMHQAIAHFYRHADAASAHEVLDDAVAATTAGPWHDEAVALRATLLTISGEVDAAHRIAAPLLVDRGPDRVLIQAALAATHALRAAGHATKALEVADLAVASYEVLGPQATLVSQSMLGVTRCLALVTLGDLTGALAVGDAARDAALHSGDLSTEGAAELVRADILGALGRVDDAVRAARASEAAFTRLNHLAFRRWAVSQRCLLATFVDDDDALAAGLAQLDALGEHPARLFEHAIVIARAWALHRAGAQEAATTALADGARRLTARGERMGAALCWNALARLGAHGAGVELSALAEQMDGTLVGALAHHASAFDAADGEALLAAAEELAALGALTWAVPAARQAAQALTDPRSATGASALVARWTSSTGLEDGRRSSTESTGISPLTRREREVALLAAQGLASRSIGERLFLSPRTVENHLARAYDKLGIRSRAELAHALATA